jgi:hypothetical protein
LKTKSILLLIGTTLAAKSLSSSPSENARGWSGLLFDLKWRGLNARPQLAIAHGALKLSTNRPATCEQRAGCTTPRRARQAAGEPTTEGQTCLQEISMAETKADAERLNKYRDVLLTL